MATTSTPLRMRRARASASDDDRAVGEADDALGASGEREVVRHQDDGGARFAIERLEQLDDVRAGVAVEVAGGLVGEEHARRVAEGARDGDALLLAAGELVGKWCARSPSPTRASSSRRARRRAVVAAQLERDLHVLERGERGDELEALEDEADFRPAELRALIFVEAREIGAVEQHGAARRDVESGEQAEQRRLAAARGPDDGDERAVGNGEVTSRSTVSRCSPLWYSFVN